MRILVTYSFVSIAVFISLALANIYTPQCQIARSMEATLNAASVGVIFISIAPFLFYVYSKGDEGKRFVPLIFFLFFSSAPTFWPTMSREFETKRQYWSFDGIVTNKYISDNHAAKSLSINGKAYEFVPLNMWQKAQVGDTIEKQVCNNVVLINGKETKFNEEQKTYNQANPAEPQTRRSSYLLAMGFRPANLRRYTAPNVLPW